MKTAKKLCLFLVKSGLKYWNQDKLFVGHRRHRALNRLISVDALRGFALAGVALVHMVEQYIAGPHPEGFMEGVNGIPDQIIQGMSGVMSITGAAETAPYRVGYPIADTIGWIARISPRLLPIYLVPPMVYAATLAGSWWTGSQMALISGAPMANWWVMVGYMILGLGALGLSEGKRPLRVARTASACNEAIYCSWLMPMTQ